MLLFLTVKQLMGEDDNQHNMKAKQESMTVWHNQNQINHPVMKMMNQTQEIQSATQNSLIANADPPWEQNTWTW